MSKYPLPSPKLTPFQSSLPFSVQGKRDVDTFVLASACALALAGIPASSWADSCTSATTTINTSISEICTLTAGESVDITSNGSLTYSTFTPLRLGAGAGHVTNAGVIFGAFGNAPAIFVSSATTADIINSGTIRNDSPDPSNRAIGLLAGSGVLNKIINTGLIESIGGNTSSAIGNYFQITNGIDNSGTIRGKTTAIGNMFTTSTIGGIRNIRNINAGVIEAIGTDGYGITNNGLISHGIVNSGFIIGNRAGIYNNGIISSNANGYAIDNRGGIITGGILNSGTLDGKVALDTAGLVLEGNAARVSGDINGAATSSVTINNDFTAEAAANVGTIVVKNGAALKFVTNQNWSGSNSFTNNGNVVIGNATTPAVTLTTANYTQTASGTLTIGADSNAQYGKLAVTGTATFAPNANIVIDVASVNSLSAGTLNGIITAGTLNASTFNVSDNSALYNFTALNTGTRIDLRVVLNNPSGGVRAAVTDQRTWSALHAADVLDTQLNGASSGDMSTVLTALGQLPDNRAVARAATQTLPLLSSHQALQGTLRTFQNLVQARATGSSGLSSGDSPQDKQAWARVFGSRADQDDRSGTAGFSADSWGMAFGADTQLRPDTRLGLAYAYAKTALNGNADLSGTAQRANIDSHIVSAYGSKDLNQGRQFSWQADLGFNSNSNTRHIAFAGLNRNASADYRSYSAHIGAAITQAINISAATTVTPGLRADYTWIKSQGYSETGANALNLNVQAQKTDAFVLGADARLQHLFSPASRLDVNFGVGYDAINKRGNIIAAYAGAPGQAFVTNGIDHSPWLARGGIAYVHTTTSGTEITLRYDAEGRSDYLNQTASVRAKWAF